VLATALGLVFAGVVFFAMLLLIKDFFVTAIVFSIRIEVFGNSLQMLRQVFAEVVLLGQRSNTR